MCKHHHLDQQRRQHLVTKLCSSCSTQVLEMPSKKLLHRNCALSQGFRVAHAYSIYVRYNRNWRYHKELRLWITKESGMAPSQKVQGGEQGQYTYWEPENWTKERKEMTVMYADLEEKTVPAFAPTPNLVLAQNASQTHSVGQHQVAQSQLPGQVPQGHLPTSQRSFPMSMAGL
jgi:hypothetical protein